MEDEKLIKELKHLKVTACVCGCTTFLVMGEPHISNGSAQIRMLICANQDCKVAVDVSDGGKVGTKRKIFDLAPSKNQVKQSTFSIDGNGKKHHRMYCETGHLGGGIQKN